MNIIDREKIKKLEDLPNVGKAIAEDLRVIGIQKPEQLINESPIKMYESLCKKTETKHDLCVLDVFMSIVSFMNGDKAQPWWNFTKTRKELFLNKDKESM